jgi:hypothetical protein
MSYHNELPWIEDKKRISAVYFEAINKNNLELFRLLKIHFEAAMPIFPLVEFIIERLETVTNLTLNERIWDAEIILRSAIETFLKFVFITTADNVERKIRLDEFWNLLAEVNSIKQSEQAKKNLVYLGGNELHYLAYSPLVLSEERENELRKKWTKKDRQKIEQKWSFNEIVNSLAKSYRGKPMDIIVTLSHGYRMSSHVTHGDETGILIIKERNSRPFRDRELAHFTHYLRLLSDVSTYCAFVGIETMHFLNLGREFFFKNQESLLEVRELTEKYHNELFLDMDYDIYRSP